MRSDDEDNDDSDNGVIPFTRLIPVACFLALCVLLEKNAAGIICLLVLSLCTRWLKKRRCMRRRSRRKMAGTQTLPKRQQIKYSPKV
jgi:hypothetical protein